jgi:hypothetical protein
VLQGVVFWMLPSLCLFFIIKQRPLPNVDSNSAGFCLDVWKLPYKKKHIEARTV